MGTAGVCLHEPIDGDDMRISPQTICNNHVCQTYNTCGEDTEMIPSWFDSVAPDALEV